jgi:hypothetical protein
MPDPTTPPETLTRTVTPDQVLERFERIREQYRMGILDLEAFNAALKLFQFPDAQGVRWTVGATSNRWYRWDGSQWQPGNPPERLELPEMPLELRPATGVPALPETKPPSRPAGAASCPKCGAENAGKKFCTRCGTKLG